MMKKAKKRIIRRAYKIGEIVEVVDTGSTYSSYLTRTAHMGGDVNPKIVDSYYERGQKTAGWMSQNEHNRNFKWKMNTSPRLGLHARVLNVFQERAGWLPSHILIESLDGKRQFLIGPGGLRLIEKPNHLPEDLFEI